MATISEALTIAIQHHQAGRLQAAEQIYRQILQAQPNQADALHFLGVIAHQTGNSEAAVQYLRRAIALSGNTAPFHNNLGEVYRALGRTAEAVACWRRALELKPDYPEAHYNLGVAFNDQGKTDEAVACWRRAVELKPDFFLAHNNLGNALKDRGKLDEAVACHRRALALKPDYAEAHNNLGLALKDQGRAEEAVACCRRALELKPDYAEVHSNLLLSLQYCTGITPVALAEAHAEFDRRHAAPLGGAVARHENVRDRQGRLRLGFVSPDLYRHPVGNFLVGVLENLGRDRQETICYSDRTANDDLTHRLQAAASQWRDVCGMNDQRLAEQIRSDRVDVLFDLAGHTAHNRLLVFARKPAPIQITWLGYVGTTGLHAMDYLLADRNLVPPGAEPYYCEKVLRMPDDFTCYSPPDDAPAPGPLPALERGHVTFGSFNNLCKITPQVVEVWSGILHRVARSRLVIRYRGLNDAGTRERFLGLFADQGIAGARVDLVGWSPFAARMDLYNQIDLGLDPFPYSGATTTCDALWMGVPVVTCPGETFASRQSLTHILAVGLEELVARDLPDYVDRAVDLAGDLSRLADLRARLRGQMAASPLCDGKRFAANLMSILQGVWQRWIEVTASPRLPGPSSSPRPSA
jgi:predicted O-linked N-acetylglucosamine transferase (SPINDLY family)